MISLIGQQHVTLIKWNQQIAMHILRKEGLLKSTYPFASLEKQWDQSLPQRHNSLHNRRDELMDIKGGLAV
jgi:hypothetical protein